MNTHITLKKKDIKAQGEILREEGTEKNHKNVQKTILKMAISTYMLIITVKRINVPMKRHGVAEWGKKKDPSARCLQWTHFRSKQTESEGMEKTDHEGENERKLWQRHLHRQNRL